mmetsp:Transcript_81251/g.161203  ORF Transcript_81251/g.161203 Transcript_81251/m.161203 type:complete len:497 (-) Transcript_81251:58-1548(-)
MASLAQLLVRKARGLSSSTATTTDPEDLREPLLNRSAPPVDLEDASACSSTSSVPRSFKAARVRKTKEFIGSARQQENARGVEVPLDVDPRLLDGPDSQSIMSMVAGLIVHYVKEGNAASPPQVPLDDEFHDEHFLLQHCCGCCPRRAGAPQQVTADGVLTLISDLARSLFFCKQVIVLCAVYVEKLVNDTEVILTTGNWRSVLIVALLIASKVWEDVHPWNADFEECLQDIAGIRYRQGALYRLESIFLDKLRWKVFVDAKVYAAYFFSLKEGSRPRVIKKPCRERTSTDSWIIETIMEGEEDNSGVDSDVNEGNGKQRSILVLPPTSLRQATPTSPKQGDISPLPWSRKELVSDCRRFLLEDDDGPQRDARSRAIHGAWTLDKRNPMIGALRHAPPAAAPSPYLAQAPKKIWEKKLATETANMLGPALQKALKGASVHTISGATGATLAWELRNHLDRRPMHGETLQDLFPEAAVGPQASGASSTGNNLNDLFS